MVRESTTLRMLVCASPVRSFLVWARGWHQIGWKETKLQPHMEEIDLTRWFGKTYIVSWPCILGMHSIWLDCKSNEGITMNLGQSNWKVTCLGKSHSKTVAWSYDMKGYARKCVERYFELSNNNNEQWSQVSTQSLVHFAMKRRIGNGWRIAKSLCSIVVKLVIGMHWYTGHSLVGGQIVPSSHKMDRSLWQTLGSFYFVHSF